MGTVFLFYLICILLLSAGCVYAAARFELRYEEALPVVLTGIMLLMFLFGVIGLLPVGVYALCALACVLYAAAIRHASGKLRALAARVFTPAGLLFLAVFAGLLYLNYGRHVKLVDEMSHWADTVKAMFYTGKLSSARESNVGFRSYPPGMAQMEYLFARLYALLDSKAGFTEWVLYVAYQCFLLSFSFPFLRALDLKKPLRFALAAGLVLMCPLMTDGGNPYCSLYVDPFLCAVLGGGLAAVFSETEKERPGYDLYIFSCCTALVLAKPVGLLLAIFLAAVYMAELLLRNGKRRGRRLLLASAATFVPFGLWSLRQAVDGVEESFSGKSGAVDLRLVLRYALHRGGESWQQGVHDAYYRRLFTETVRIKGFACPYWLLLLLSAAAIWALIRLTRRRGGDLRAAERLALPALALIVTVYCVSLCYIYIFKYIQMEAELLAQFKRYVSIVLYTVCTAALLCLVRYFTERDSGRGAVCAALSAFLLLSPFGRALELAKRMDAEAVVPFYEEYYALEGELKELSGGKPLRVFWVGQGQMGEKHNLAHYILRPNTISPDREWFLGPAPELPWLGELEDRMIPAEDWMRELRENYDYLYLEHIDDYFLAHYSSLFAPGSEPVDKGLYRVGEQLEIMETEGLT